jgi:hypothetical protein
MKQRILTRPNGGLLGAAAGLAVLAGCGAANSPDSAGSNVVEVRYATSAVSEDERVREHLDVIADGDRRTRVTVISSDDGSRAGTWLTWDGAHLLTHDANSDPPYSRTENPAGEEVDGVIFVLSPGSRRFESLCPNARRMDTQTIAGRVAVHYACDKRETADFSQPAHQLWLDQQDDLLLKDAGPDYSVVATKVTMNPQIDADTFSTELPKGAEDANHPKLDDFRLTRVGGGELALTSYRNRPLVIVAGEADGIRRMVQRLLPMTASGTKPQVLGLLYAIPAEDWTGSLLNPADETSFAESVAKSAGTFDVPVGIDIKGNAAYQISLAAGVDASTSPPTTVGFVRTDGTLAQITTDAATDAELQSKIADLL